MSAGQHLNEMAGKAVPYLLGIIIALGGFVWSDVRAGLDEIRLIRFQQIKDGKDIDRHAEQIRDMEARLRAKGISDQRNAYQIRSVP